MTANVAAIRRAYQVAEDKDVAGWVSCFAEDGTFGELYRFYEDGDTVCYPSGTIIHAQLGLLPAR